MKKLFYTVGLFLMVILVLKLGKFILAPIVLSAIIATLLSNSTQFLIDKGMNLVFAAATTTIVVFSTIGLIVTILTFQYIDILNHLPSWDEKIISEVDALSATISTRLGISEDLVVSTITRIKTAFQSSPWVSNIWQSIVSTASYFFLIPVFVFFMLFYPRKFKDAIELWLERRSKTKSQRFEIMKQANQSLNNYMKGTLLVILILAVLNVLGLLLLGVPYFILLGISAALLSVIPYFGNILGGGLTVIISYASTGDSWLAVYVIILFAVIQILEGNLITPFIMKDEVNLNPFSIILVLLIGGAIWGIIGMLISVPVLAILKVYMQKDKDLKDYAVLLGEEEPK